MANSFATAGTSALVREGIDRLPLTSGEIRFRGEAIHGRETPDIAQLGIAYVPETMGIFSDLTVQENMVLAARTARHAAGALSTLLRCRQGQQGLFALVAQQALSEFGGQGRAGGKPQTLIKAQQLGRAEQPDWPPAVGP